MFSLKTLSRVTFLTTFSLNFLMALPLQAAVPADKMTNAARTLFVSLSEPQKEAAVLGMDSKKYTNWRYFPEPHGIASLILPERKGISLESLNSQQLIALKTLLQEGLSDQGLDAVEAAIELDKDSSVELRGKLNLFLFNYGPKNYFLTFFNSPFESKWAWRLEGHHVSVNYKIEDGDIVSSVPLFIGTTLKEVTVNNKNVKPLADVAEASKNLVSSLSTAQLSTASQAIKKVPNFNPVAPGILGGKEKIPSNKLKGLALSEMTADQKTIVGKILVSYQDNLERGLADQNLAAISTDDLENSQFFWVGDTTMEKPFYFRIVGPKFVLEFNTSEGHADHYHTAWISY